MQAEQVKKVDVYYIIPSEGTNATSVSVTEISNLASIIEAIKAKNKNFLGGVDDIKIRISWRKGVHGPNLDDATVKAGDISQFQSARIAEGDKNTKDMNCALQVEYPDNKNDVQVQPQQPQEDFSQMFRLLSLEQQRKYKIISNYAETDLSIEGSNHVSSVCGNKQFVSQLRFTSNVLFLLPNEIDLKEVTIDMKKPGKQWTNYVKKFLEDDCQKELEIAQPEYPQLRPFNIFNIQGYGSIHIMVEDDFCQQRQFSCTLGDYAVLPHQKTKNQMFTDLSTKENVISSLLVCIESQSSPKTFEQALAQLNLTLTLHLRKGTIKRGYGILCGHKENEKRQKEAWMQVVKCDPYRDQPTIYNGIYPMKASNFIAVLLAILEKIKEES